MSGTCPTSTPSPPSPTLTLTPIPPTSTPPSWPCSLPTIFSTLSLDSVRTLPPISTTMLLSIATLFMTTVLLLWRSSRNRSRARRDTIQQLRRQLEEANAKQARYEVQLEQEQEASRQREEQKRRALEEKQEAEEGRKRVAEEKRRLEQEARALKSRLEEREKQQALLRVGILKLKRKAETVGSKLDGANREVQRRTKQLARLVEQAAPFLELLRIDLDVDLPSIVHSPSSPLPSASTAIETRAGSTSYPKHETDPDELLPKSLLTSLNSHISSLSAKLADEGVRVIREVEDALDDADSWVNAMHREEALSLEEGSELEVDSDRDRDRGSPRQGRQASPHHPQQGAKQAKETQTRSQIPVLISSSMYFPPTERRLTDSPRSLHEVELPPAGPPPRGPLPPIPPSPPRAPAPPPKPSSIPRPLPTASESRLRAPSSASSQPRPFSAPVQSSPPRHQRASPPPALPLSGPVLQKPPRTTPPDLQHSPPTQYMYPYPYSNQQQPMGIPVSLAKGFASAAPGSARQSPSSVPLALSGSTSTHRSSKPPSQSSSAASLVPFPSSSSGSLAGARPSSISSAQWDKLGPYDRQVLLQAQRERVEREREARLEARRLAKLQARRERQAEREARRREREATKVENEKRRKEEQSKREEAVEARLQAGEVFGEGLVGMLKEVGVRRGVFTEKVERKASTPTPKASLNRGKREGSGEGSSGDSGSEIPETGRQGSGNGNGNGNGNGHGEGDGKGEKQEKEKGKEKEVGQEQDGKSKIDLHTTLKLAFQTALCAYTHWMMCSWFFEDERGGVAAGNGAGDAGGHEGGEGLEGLLGEVYARVREGEEQLVSGLWRALTRKHVQRMLPGASSGSSSKRSSKDSERQGRVVAGEDGEESEEEDDGRPDTLIEELCIYIIDALVNVLIVAGAHGGWYVGSGEENESEEDGQEVDEEDDDDDDIEDDSGEDIIVFPTYQHPAQRPSSHHTPQQLVPTYESGSGGGDYNTDLIELDSDLYHDPYQGYSISQLSEFLSVTPTADTFKIGGRRTGQAAAGNVLLQGQQRPYTRSQSQPPSHVPPSSRLSDNQQPQRTAAPPNTRPSPRRSRSVTRLQAHSESTSKYTQEHLHAHITATFKAPLMRILKKARVLNKVLGEEVVRCDLEALYVAPGVVFVGDMMERGTVEQVNSHTEERGVKSERGQEPKDEVDVDLDLNDDGEDTPRPASSPNSKKGTGGKASSQQGSAKGVDFSQSMGGLEPPPQHHQPQVQGDSPERANLEEDNSGSRDQEGSEDAEILCTTQLGLVRAEKVPRTRGEWDEVVLVKPVVILVRDVVST